VRVGIGQGEQIQITEGLKAGDKIVGSGAYGLPDNTAIKPEETTAGATRDPTGNFFLVFAPVQASHFSHSHAGASGWLSCVHNSDFGFSHYQFSAHPHRR